MARYDMEHGGQSLEAESVRVRAQLNLRLGKHRLERGRTTAGIVALYDSVLCGLRYYIARHKGCAALIENTDLWDAPGLFHALARTGIFDDPLALNRFSLNVERALWQSPSSFDASATVAEVETILTRLGVIPMHA